jgi:hypothetical protein
VITIEIIKAAQENDLQAVACVVGEMSSRNEIAAKHAARKLLALPFTEAVDHMRVAADSALWEFIATADVDSFRTADDFRARAYRFVEQSLRSEARAIRGIGESVTPNMMKAFNKAVERADGDVALAEKLAQIHPYGNTGRLSPALAYAARLAWEGCISADDQRYGRAVIDEVAGPHPDFSKTDTDAHYVGVHRIKAAFRALEDHIVVSNDADALMDACFLLSHGEVTEEALDVLSENIRMPRDRQARLFVHGSFGILAAAVRSAEHSATPSDEYDDQAEENPERCAHVARAQTVRAILANMSDNQSAAVSHAFGIGDATFYGCGDSGDFAGMANEMQCTEKQAKDRLRAGKKRFTDLWIKAMSRSAEHADKLRDAAAQCLKRGGRK